MGWASARARWGASSRSGSLPISIHRSRRSHRHYWADPTSGAQGQPSQAKPSQAQHSGGGQAAYLRRDEGGDPTGRLPFVRAPLQDTSTSGCKEKVNILGLRLAYSGCTSRPLVACSWPAPGLRRGKGEGGLGILALPGGENAWPGRPSAHMGCLRGPQPRAGSRALRLWPNAGHRPQRPGPYPGRHGVLLRVQVRLPSPPCGQCVPLLLS
jgi:hypothetical protein